MDEWEVFSETTLPTKVEIYSNLNTVNIIDVD